MNDTLLTRRTVLTTAGGLALAGTGLAMFSNRASAQVQTNFVANNPETLVNDDGSVRKVLLDVNGEFAWNGFDSSATSATVNVYATVDGTREKLATATYGVGGLHGSGSYNADGTEAQFNGIDLTEYFGDAAFENDQDGNDTAITPVTITAEVLVTTVSGATHSNSASGTMDVDVDNEEATADVSGESSAIASSYHQKYSAPYVNETGIGQPIEDGLLHLYVFYGRETVAYEFVFDEPEDSDYSLADPGFASTNLAMGFDSDGDGVADFQLAWDPDAGFPDAPFGYSGVTSEPRWEKDTAAGWQPLPTGFDAEKDGARIVFEVPRVALGSDDDYLFGALAGAGGEQPYAAIGNEPGKFWSSANNFTSSEYFLAEEIVAGFDAVHRSADGELTVGIAYEDGQTEFHVVAPSAFDDDALPAGYQLSHVELFLDGDDDGNWDTQVRRQIGSNSDGTATGLYYQHNGGSWESDFAGTDLSVETTDDGFAVVATGPLAQSGTAFGVGADGTLVTATGATTEKLGPVTETGAGKPWHTGNLLDEQVE